MLDPRALTNWVAASRAVLLELAAADSELRIYVSIENGMIGEPQLLPPLVSLVPKQDPDGAVPITFVEQRGQTANYVVVNIGL